MKKLVPPTRSSSSKTPAANKTANESRAKTAVISHDQQVSGMRPRDRPRVRRFKVVAMKFRAPRSEPTQNRAMEMTHKV